MEEDLKSLCSVVFWVKLLFPAVIVFGAMYWAQSIFNKNARKRENRERRLSHIEDCIASVFILSDMTTDYLLSENEEFDAKFMAIKAKLSGLHTSTSIFKLGIKGTLTEVLVLLCSLYGKRTTDIENGIYIPNVTDPEVQLLADAQSQLATDLRVSYRRIENEH